MLRGDLLRSHSALPGEIEQIRELFRTRRNVVLTTRCPVALRRGFALFCGGIPLMIAGHIFVKFCFDRVPYEVEGFMNPGLQLILSEPVRKFDLDRSVIALTLILFSGGNLLGIRRIEFQHNTDPPSCFSRKISYI